MSYRPRPVISSPSQPSVAINWPSRMSTAIGRNAGPQCASRVPASSPGFSSQIFYRRTGGLFPPQRAVNLDPPGRAPCELGDPNRPGGVEQSLQPEFTITLGCVSSGEQTGCFLDIDGLHEYAFLPIGQVGLALA